MSPPAGGAPVCNSSNPNKHLKLALSLLNPEESSIYIFIYSGDFRQAEIDCK